MSSTSTVASAHDNRGVVQDSSDRATFWRANRVSLIAGVVAVVLAGLVRFVVPYDREITSIWVFLAKPAPVIAAGIAIAWLDVGWARRLKLHLFVLPAVFLLFFCWFVPKILLGARAIEKKQGEFADVYLDVVMMVAFVILALLLAYRLGGGKTETIVRLTFALLLIQISGLEDLSAVLLNENLDGIPDTWDWADHMTVRLGHPASKYEAFTLIAAHLAAAIAVLVLPGRFYSAIGRRFRPGGAR